MKRFNWSAQRRQPAAAPGLQRWASQSTYTGDRRAKLLNLTLTW